MNREVDTSHAITRTSSPALDAILGHAFPVLDQGMVRVIDYMGDDAAIIQMARVSYGDGTKGVSDDRSLLRYLMRHWHTSPFEGCEVKLHVKLPVFVARQWIRHRMANVNEYSGRYSVMRDEFYMPEAGRLGIQSTANKQGTGEGYNAADALAILDQIENVYQTAMGTYQTHVDEHGYNLSRELARNVLPVSIYTEWYWKTDLHNLFHFLRLRCDPHAQWEIRQYADTISDLVAKWVPYAHEAWVDYRRDAVTFSRMEMEVIREWMAGYIDGAEYSGPCVALRDAGASNREIREFAAKLGA